VDKGWASGSFDGQKKTVSAQVCVLHNHQPLLEKSAYTVLRTWAEQTFRLQSRNNVDAGRGSRQPSAQRFCPCLPPACQILPRQPAFRGIDVRVLWALEMDPSIRTQKEASCHNKSAYLRTWPSGQARSLFDSSAGCCPCLSRERAWDVPVFDWEHRAAWSSPQKA
jgi:hypothetical protein